MEKLPKEYQDYQWIADRFAQIDGVEMILLNTQAKGTELNMMITNNKPQPSNKMFIFPLKTTFVIDYVAAENCINDWDINLFTDPEMILNMAIAKAKVVFEDLRPN